MPERPLRVLYVMRTAAPDGSSASLHRVEDVVVDGVTGLIVPPRDPDALARAIARLADDARLRAQLGAAARLAATNRSEPALVAHRIVKIYRDVLARRTRPEE